MNNADQILPKTFNDENHHRSLLIPTCPQHLNFRCGDTVMRRNAAIVLVIFFYLVFNVANGEYMQGIMNGAFSKDPYNQPPFLNWSVYCSFILCWIPVWIGVKFSLKMSMKTYLLDVWAANVGIGRMALYCLGLMVLLTLLNILWIIGLDGVSVATSTAVFQLQTIITVSLSMLLFGTDMHRAEIAGTLLCLSGVTLIVVPPLFDDKESSSSESYAPANTRAVIGIFATFLSAIICAIYQVTWKVIMRQRGLANDDDDSGDDGGGGSDFSRVLDAFTMLAVMGLWNTFFCWPVVSLLDISGVVPFQWPALDLWPLLTANALIELAFDVFCVVTIYLTSPVVAAVTLPLCIPISFIWDHLQYGAPLTTSAFSWFGSLLVMGGVAWMELKYQPPSKMCCCSHCCERSLLLTTEKSQIELEYQSVQQVQEEAPTNGEYI